MTTKENILNKIRRNISETYDMPDFSNLKPTTYADVTAKFKEAIHGVGGEIISPGEGQDINDVIRKAFPDAKHIASNVEGITIADENPDTVERAQDLDHTDLGIVRGEVGVAENGCIWIPQTMKERAVCFISEQLVIILDRRNIVNNMHEAYDRITMTGYGYGCFISGPSKTADIAQALVMGAQAARSVTVILV